MSGYVRIKTVMPEEILLSEPISESEFHEFDIVRILAAIIDVRDRYTRDHSLRVAQYAAVLAEELEYQYSEIRKLRSEALLHDIGKIGVPTEFLNKTGKITPEEFTVIKTHTVFGSEILRQSKVLQEAADAARHHHERIDGKGYPDGLSGDEIERHVKIISIADTFDAMRSDRPYEKALPDDMIRQYLISEAGTHFDRKLVQVFVSLLDRGYLNNLQTE